MSDDTIQKLHELIRTLEEENKYLKGLLDDAGITYDRKQSLSPKNDDETPAIKEEVLTKDKVRFFYSMFQGRKDVYSLRSGRPSKKTGKYGYYPQCANIWDYSLCGKVTNPKTKCADCPNQSYKPLSGDVLVAHLQGAKSDCSDVVGLYPVLPDGTCNYLVFDFDDHDEGSDSLRWQEEVNALRKICEINDVPCLVERSRSGKGAHVWILFESPVEVKRARQFGAALLDKGAESVNQISFDTYDRMIPAQDKLPSGGLGNLVALPLQGQAVKNGNSVFVDADWIPYYDQWDVLRKTGKISSSFISDKIALWEIRYTEEDINTSRQISIDETPWENKSVFSSADVDGKLRIVMADRLYIDKTRMKPKLQNKIRRLAAYNNPEYFKKQAIGLPTFGIPRIVYSGEDTDQYIAIPRGCLEKLCSNLQLASIEYAIEDKRNDGKSIDVAFAGNLYPEQKEAADHMLEHDIGVLSAATGFGKTAVGSFLISERKVNTLILVHTNEIMQNWLTDLERFLEIHEDYPQYTTKTGRIKTRKSLIGKLSGSHNSLTGIIDVAMVSSLGKGENVKQFVKDYGMVIMDECHHSAADTIESVLSEVNARYVYGLTATVKREDGKEKTVLMQFGPVRYTFTAKDKVMLQGIEHVLEPRFTPITSAKEKLTANEAYDIVVNSDIRNNLIASDIEKCVAQGHTPLVLSKRKTQLETLYDKVKDKADHVLVLTGGKTPVERNKLRDELNSISQNDSLIILATGQYIGEGFNYSRLDTLFLAMPIAWDGNVEQYTGRLNRSFEGKDKVTVVDYVDHHIDMFANMYNKRLKTYRRIGYELAQGAETKPAEEFFFDKDTYYRVLSEDYRNANSEIVISSPYVSSAGVERLIRDDLLCDKEAVSIKLITYSSVHYSEDIRGRIDTLHNKLVSSGVEVQYEERISSRYAVIDREIIWYGSMNLLSSIKDDDDEMRIVNKEIASSLLID